MIRPALVVCEPVGRWAGALRQALGGRPPRLVETQRIADLWQEVTSAPASVVALAWSSARRSELAEVADRLGRWFPLARLVVLLERQDRAEAALVRELGAVMVVSSTRQAADVVRLARRHTGPEPAGWYWPAMDQLVERMWEALPWNLDQTLERSDRA